MQAPGAPPNRPLPLDPGAIVPAAITATVTTTATAFRLTRRVAGWTERQVMGALRSRLDHAAPVAPPALPPAPSSASGTSGTLHAKLTGLLDQALELGSAESREALFTKLLDQIVPDEARILGALSDGSSSPLVHVRSRGRGGLMGATVLENAAGVGKAANIGLPHLTPMYVSHLLALGLVEIGPEDPALKQDYEILAADSTVLAAIRSASRGPFPAAIERHTLRLSDLGHELWRAASER